MKIRSLFAKIASLSLLGLGLVSQGIWAQVSGGNHPSFVPGRILVKFKDGVSDGQARGLLAARNALSTNVISQLGVHIVQLPPNANEQAEADAFKGLDDVEFAEVDAILQPQSVTPNDYYYFIGYQWALPKISAPAAWSVTTGSSSVVIAVIDTGVDSTQPDLQGKLVPGWNIYDNNSSTTDVASHGTIVAGIVGASTNNGIGVAGVCWNCRVMPVRVTALDQSATFSNIASGIIWAADHGARVANVSYTCTSSSTVSSAAQYLQSKGGVLTVAAGNYGVVDTNPNDPYIITVGATDQNDALYSGSATGSDIDLVAPGVGFSTMPFNLYGAAGGTSVAAPFVAGVAGLMLSVNPNLTPSQVTSLLQQSTDDLGAAGWDSTYGWGRINALKAVNNASCGNCSPILIATTTTLNSTLDPSVSGQSVTFTATISSSAATGTVTFKDGSTTLGSGTLSSGRATLSTSSLSVGSHSITASYGGNSSYSSSVSAILSETVNTTSKTNTTTSLVSSLNPATSGQTVTFTATVSPSTATGTVTFFDGPTSLGSGTLSSGRATLSTASLAAGTHSITANYGGNTSYNSSASTILSETVNTTSKTNTTTSLTSNLNPSMFGQAVTFTATVSPSTATGTVTFFNGATSLGSITLSSGRASLSTAGLSGGTHSITASYSGNTTYNLSTSSALSQSVNRVNTTTSLTSNVNPSNVGQLVTFSMTVSPSAATGTVTLFDGTIALGTATVSGGFATWSTTSLPKDSSLSITATYNGNSNYNPSTSPVLIQKVHP